MDDKFLKTGSGTLTALGGAGKDLAADTITVTSTENIPTDTDVVIAIRRVDSDGGLIAGTYTEWLADVTSDTTISLTPTPVYGSDQVYPAGATTQVYIPLSSYGHNRLVDGMLVEHNQDGTHKTSLVNTIKATLLAAVYPVGSIYTNATDATNPSTLLGFGTWVAFGAGRVPVGFNNAEAEFNTPSGTGGSKTHTLTTTEMPTHSHSASTLGGGDHQHNYQRWSAVIQNAVAASDAARYIVQGEFTETTPGGQGAHNHTISVGNAGNGGAHNNLQPYIVVYMWRRSA